MHPSSILLIIFILVVLAIGQAQIARAQSSNVAVLEIDGVVTSVMLAYFERGLMEAIQ